MEYAPLVENTTRMAGYLLRLTKGGHISRCRPDGSSYYRYYGPENAPVGDAFPEQRIVEQKPAPAVKPAARVVRSSGPVVTPDWRLYPVDDGLVLINKETDTGFRLDAETVAAIKELV